MNPSPRQALTAAPYYGLVDGEVFDGADLVDVELNHLRLDRCSFVGADLTGARLDECSFRFCDMRGARLGRASLRGARLMGCDLSGADLTGADLTGARLGFVNTGPDARLSDVTGAVFDQAVLVRTIFDRVTGWTFA